MMKVLLTGHTGFLGDRIYRELQNRFEVITVGRNPLCDYYVDFTKWNGELQLDDKIEAIVHVAALAHKKYTSEKDLFHVNTKCVEYLINFATQNRINCFVFISSVSVYGLKYGLGINEDVSTMGSTPYAKSKILAEELVHQWQRRCEAHTALSMRLPLIIGRNAPGNLGRLKFSIEKGNHLFLRGNSAKKSMVFSSDVAVFIANWLGADKRKSGSFNFCNEVDPTFNWIEESLKKIYDGSFKIVLPILFVRTVILWLHLKLNITLPFLSKLLLDLTFSDEKARRELGYQSKAINYQTLKEELDDTNY